MRTPQSYTKRKATQRINRRSTWQAGQTALGAGSNTDGIQALMEIMEERGERCSQFLYDRLMAADYEVPEAIKPLAEVAQ